MSTDEKLTYFRLFIWRKKTEVYENVNWRKVYLFDVYLFWREKSEVYEFVNLTKSWLILFIYIKKNVVELVDENISWRKLTYFTFIYFVWQEKDEVYECVNLTKFWIIYVIFMLPFIYFVLSLTKKLSLRVYVCKPEEKLTFYIKTFNKNINLII